MGVTIVNNKTSETVGGLCCGKKEFKRGKASHYGHLRYSISTSNNSKALIASRKLLYVMALIACFGVVLERALQNTPTFPLQTVSADPVQQRGHERGA